VPVLTERIETRLPIDEAFAYVADFANASTWDPGVASSERDGRGPLQVGARYRLGVRVGGRVAPMAYTVTLLDPPRRVVLEGRGSGVAAVDDIRFDPAAGGAGTVITYVADIRLVGMRRLLAPFAGAAFRRVAANARAGMERALERRASEQRAATPTGLVP
jgi:carbon monoxide dehydrogenase subunit G